ncbi:Unknown protein [Striga hermonthica]|uniref:Uncharacterized protein n=1 Tax=Striga hermonthica TaxID=68872 RepID=A0A9N7NQI6_STRHE|nr:Unknown protein [Striga hermonthica]
MKNTIPVAQIKENARGWTTLIQVVERGKILVSQRDTAISYRHFVFADSDGTKVSAVAYNNNIRASSTLLLPFKKYYVSGATLKKADDRYKKGPYPFTWTINNNTLIQPCEDEAADQLFCHIECQRFADLHRFVDMEDLQNIQGVVVHAFEVKQIGLDSVNRDIVLVNNE